MGRGWFWHGPWPGKGAWSYIPPWERPGWIIKHNVWTSTMPKYKIQAEIEALESYKKALEEELKMVEERIKSLKKQMTTE
ncbi:DUF5320 domain-containing protein [Staphylothermus hellenicus]|uniref:Uncharacterized protein n=1 Tax=Staphylothermus hellenicus (strain DSM 12710 / JCM 10830 / BK20S6-10-b1 / P8) TaxID=591019 RepID=D7DA64_STAHD|nr:DUF5320 domain-containing protein [Staphylothermus hellenicus]ADI32660.1 hypothetical protein Shell_1572 [Staphylothermus hellenicus DSM 12710]